MSQHDSLHKLVQAERLLLKVRDACSTSWATTFLDDARKLIWDVGNDLYPEDIKEARDVTRKDPMQ